MARHGFGRGEYRLLFAYPLPAAVERLRTALYPRLGAIANGWHERLGLETRFPADHAEYIAHLPPQAARSGPTPLLLRYGPGDYNCLHQDLYGAEVFCVAGGGCCCHKPACGFHRRRIRADRTGGRGCSRA